MTNPTAMALPCLRGITEEEVCEGTPATVFFAWRDPGSRHVAVWPSRESRCVEPHPATVTAVAHEGAELAQLLVRDETDGKTRYFTRRWQPLIGRVVDPARDWWFGAEDGAKLIIGYRCIPPESTDGVTPL